MLHEFDCISLKIPDIQFLLLQWTLGLIFLKHFQGEGPHFRLEKLLLKINE